MTNILEVDSDFALGAGGVRIHKGAAAINERIKFWVEKYRRGQVWGRPDKGNDLRKYQFREATEETFALMEIEIVRELPKALPIRILAVSCAAPTSADRVAYVRIVYQSLDTGEVGAFQKDVLKKR